jgi:hypothetical protein|mmetsp:Transcript_27870/g.50492  ORF Transcript_27870/g.50492 Transcript_27870/m.50492 type:complete len:280 (-) Transcript_27870:137-976(-)
MADAEESEEMTTLMELFSGVLNRAPVEQHKFLCASLIVCTNQVKNGYQNAFQEASLNDVYPGRFDGFNFAYATELITNIVGRGEEGLLQKRVLGLPATMQDNESRVIPVAEMPTGPRPPPPPSVAYPVTANLADEPSDITQGPSFDSTGRTSSGANTTDREDVRTCMRELLDEPSTGTGSAGANAEEQASIRSADDTHMNSADYATVSGNDAEGTIPTRSTGLATLVESALQINTSTSTSTNASTEPMQETSIGTVTAAENDNLFGDENAEDAEEDGEN